MGGVGLRLVWGFWGLGFWGGLSARLGGIEGWVNVNWGKTRKKEIKFVIRGVV